MGYDLKKEKIMNYKFMNDLARSDGNAELIVNNNRCRCRVLTINSNPFEPTTFKCEIYANGLSNTNSKVYTSPFEKVIFNDPATIIIWNDGTKTVVKCQNNEPFDPEKGLAMAIAKKFFGNEGNYYNQIKKWTDDYYAEG
jgi:hypothetical protein